MYFLFSKNYATFSIIFMQISNLKSMKIILQLESMSNNIWIMRNKNL